MTQLCQHTDSNGCLAQLYNSLFLFLKLLVEKEKTSLRVQAKFSSKQEENGSNNENVCIVAGIVSLTLFNAMTGYFLYADFNSIENLSSIALDINQLLFGLLGVAMIILGNIMPKLRMNSIAGLRTVWSMKNETTWKKSQRFGGISFIVGGVIIIIVCFLTKGFSCFWWTMGIVAILLIIDTYYTYTLSKKY